MSRGLVWTEDDLQRHNAKQNQFRADVRHLKQGRLVQLAEQSPHQRTVAGSTPAAPTKRTKIPQVPSKAEEMLAFQLTLERIDFDREYPFHPERNWRFDFVIVEANPYLAVEVDGFGRHQSRKGYQDDCEKLNEALLLGWRVLRVTPAQVYSGKALEWIKRAIA